MSGTGSYLSMTPSLHLTPWFPKCGLSVAGGLQDPFRMSTKSNSFHDVTGHDLPFAMTVVTTCPDPA